MTCVCLNDGIFSQKTYLKTWKILFIWKTYLKIGLPNFFANQRANVYALSLLFCTFLRITCWGLIEINAGHLFLKVNSLRVRLVGRVSLLKEVKLQNGLLWRFSLKNSTGDNLPARIREILGNQLTSVESQLSVSIGPKHYSVFLLLYLTPREVVQQLIEEYQAATRAGYIMWGTQQQVSLLH